MNYPDFTIQGMVLKPIGIVKSTVEELMIPSDLEDQKKHIELIKSYHTELKEIVSKIEIKPEFTELLDGIDDFSHILVLYWPHKIPQKDILCAKIHPMGRTDIPRKGVFATRCPIRPNPVLLTGVKLIKRHQNILWVQGLEALDGSPILDIKPYIKIFDDFENPAMPEWIQFLQ
jgi:tRNA-Thr(GGU) m(6)t(6)A37 methyltransferase TsaA